MLSRIGRGAAVALFAFAALAPRTSPAQEAKPAAGPVDWAVMVKVDLAKLNPASVRSAAQAAMGPMAKAADLPLQQYEQAYDRATKAGVQGVRLAVGLPGGPGQEPAGAFLVSLKPGADVEAVKQLVAGSVGPAQAAKLDYQQSGNTLLVHETGSPMPSTTPEKAKAFADAFAAAGDRAVVVAMVPDDAMRQQLDGLLAKGSPPPLAKEMLPTLLQSQWITLGLALGEDSNVKITVEQPDKAGADKLLALADQGLGQLKQMTAQLRSQGHDQQANTFDGMIDPLRPTQDGARLTSTLNTPVTAMAVSILLPSLNRARDTANEIKSRQNLSQLSMALNMYEGQHNGEMPDSLDDLKPYMAKGPPGTDALENPQTGESPGYIYVKPADRRGDIKDPSVTGVFFESKNGQKDPDGSVVYADGHVAKASRQ